MNINKKNVEECFASVQKVLSSKKINVKKNFKLLNNPNIDSLLLVTFYAELEKKSKKRSNLISLIEKFKDKNGLINFLNKKK